MIEDCSALILAGGASRRMGQDKAMLLLDGQTLLARVMDTMQALFSETIVSVREPRPGLALPQVCDEVVASGPLAGLVAGLAQARSPWVFAVACDMPFVSAALVEKLADFRAGHQAVVPVVGGHPQPLAAFYSASALATMRSALEGGDLSLRGMLAGLEVRFVGEAELRAFDPQLRSFFDLDTPQDVAAAGQ